ncbi:MAG TPA: sulfotransferase [Gammaproteobacteria bacterium]|nr:sulfotransferase [Gammaproteobacteria bacterium]
MISHRRKCIFIHIPKCGGSSIEKLIWPREKDKTEANLWMGFTSEYGNKYQTGGLQHLMAKHVRQEVGEDVFDRYYKFSLVRNPYDKAVSQFEYMKKRPDLREFLGMSENDDFKTYLTLIAKKVHVQWDSQYKFILDDSGNALVDYVGRFENFDEDVTTILDALNMHKNIFGVRKKIPHTNKSTRKHYRDYYDDESKAMLEALYKKDIAMFGYAF